jgi:hypothetical protein
MLDKASFERRKLLELIREYSKLGYEVYAEYKGYPRPYKIGEFVPDLILKKGNQMIIVEIATKQDLRDLSKKTEQFARYAEEHDSARFDLVLTNPKHRLSQKEKEISNKISIHTKSAPSHMATASSRGTPFILYDPSRDFILIVCSIICLSSL